MDVFDSKEMRWASCHGVSFCGCNARLCEASALFSQKKKSRQKKRGGGPHFDDFGVGGLGFRACEDRAWVADASQAYGYRVRVSVAVRV